MYFHSTQRELRKCGYVFFDQDRLQDWDAYQKPFTPITDRGPEGFLQRAEEMKKSWHATSKIWGRGKRGWWSNGDENNLFWPYRGL